MKWLDETPMWMVVIGALALGLAPFVPEPHLVEKLRMLFAGTLARPIDIFDLLMHASLPVLLVVKLIRFARARKTG